MAMKTTRDVKGVGLSIPRPDGPEKVTGQVPYVADLKPKGMLHAKLLRSPHAHARILRIDTSKAQALPGVRACGGLALELGNVRGRHDRANAGQRLGAARVDPQDAGVGVGASQELGV